MLYHFKLSQLYELPVTLPEVLKDMPGKNLLVLTRCLNLFLEKEPELLYKMERNTLQVVYSGVSFMTERLDPYADVLAAISAAWPITLVGGVGTLESGMLTYDRKEGRTVVEKKSISGQAFEVMNGMYMEVEFPDAKTARAALRILASIRRDTDIFAVERSMETYLAEQQIAYYAEGTLFCYVSLEGAGTLAQYMEALSLGQKERLWMAFLQDHIQPREFEWLYLAMLEGYSHYFVDWSISLQKSLEVLGYRLENEQGRFHVRDSKGKPRCFDFEKGGIAERAFLKMLYPIVL